MAVIEEELELDFYLRQPRKLHLNLVFDLGGEVHKRKQ